MTGDDADILSQIRAHFLPNLPTSIGVAVSGGSDSTALLHLLTRCFASGTVRIEAVTVDHGLRPEAGKEAAGVARLAESLGVAHKILTWRDWDGRGNLQAAAREARYRLLGEWARARKIPLVALGHTADDQAETVLMQLARSAGVNGLAAMPVRRTQSGITLVRPVLAIRRAELRDYLDRHGIGWIDDPGNDDPRFDRVKARAALGHLAPLGVTVDALVAVAEHMSHAREALDWYAFLAGREIARVDQGEIVIDLRQFRTRPQEIARRLLMQTVAWVGRTKAPPRRAAVAEAISALRFGRGATLGGCRLVVAGDSIWVVREYDAVRDLVAQPGGLWDDRWRFLGPVEGADLTIRALGKAGVGQLPDWRASGRPHAVMLAMPAVWKGATLVAAPLAGQAHGWRAERTQSAEAFYAALLSN